MTSEVSTKECLSKGEIKQEINEGSKDKKILPTEDEFNKKISTYQKTTMGKLFPVVPSEYFRLLIIMLTNGLISFCYSFMRQFKTTITMRNMNVQAASWLKLPIFVFSVLSVSFANKCFEDRGPTGGIVRYLHTSAGLLAGFGFVILFQRLFWLSPGWAETVISSASYDVRGLSFLKTLILMFNHLFLCGYFILCEVVGSTLMTVVFTSFITGFITPKEYKRYLRLIIISSNIFLIISTNLCNAIIKKGFVKVSASHFNYIYVAVFIVIGLVYFATSVLVKILTHEFENKLYTSENNGKTLKKKKKGKIDYSVFGITRAIANSKLLASICVMTLGYNFSTNINTVTADHSYVAYFEFLKANPSLNKIPGFIPTKEFITSRFKSKENNTLATAVIWLMLCPVLTIIFDKFGVLGFGLISPIISCVASLSMVYWASCNYSIVNNKPLMWGIKNPFRNEIDFEKECGYLSNFNCLIKISKYSFYDYLCENLFLLISPEDRFLIKGIANGIFGKLSKTIASMLSVVLEICGLTKDPRCFSPLSASIVIVLCVTWVLSIFYLNRISSKAVANNDFILNEPFIQPKPTLKGKK